MEHARDLLAPVKRWTAGRKALLLEAIFDSVITEAQARAAHGISFEEMDEWCRGYEASRHIEGLKATLKTSSL